MEPVKYKVVDEWQDMEMESCCYRLRSPIPREQKWSRLAEPHCNLEFLSWPIAALGYMAAITPVAYEEISTQRRSSIRFGYHKGIGSLLLILPQVRSTPIEVTLSSYDKIAVASILRLIHSTDVWWLALRSSLPLPPGSLPSHSPPTKQDKANADKLQAHGIAVTSELRHTT